MLVKLHCQPATLVNASLLHGHFSRMVPNRSKHLIYKMPACRWFIYIFKIASVKCAISSVGDP